MLRLSSILIVFLLILSCSPDRAAPVAPAGKVSSTLVKPDAPTNLRFDGLTATSCTVRWDESLGATDYDVNYKRAVNG